jgi:hypothetical protein
MNIRLAKGNTAMESRLINNASGNTIKTVKNPIQWLFKHYRAVSSFDVKALQDGGGLLIAHMDDNTTFRMAWASFDVMMDRVLRSRAWSNHFWQVLVYKLDSNGNRTTTYVIK